MDQHSHHTHSSQDNKLSPLSATSRWIISGMIGAILFLFGQLTAMERRVSERYVTKSEYDAGHEQTNQRIDDVRGDLRSMRSLLDTILQEIRNNSSEKH